MARRSSLVKALVGLAAIAVVAVLFLQSVRSTRAEPYVVDRQDMTGWTLEQPPQDPFGSWLALSPPFPLAASLGREIFARGGESVNYPNPPVMPLLLRSEYERAFAGTIAPEAIVALARGAGFESLTWTPRCMAYRRVAEPRAPRATYFMLFDAPAFDRFRQQLAAQLQTAGQDPALFDPAALSPVLMVAALDGEFQRWMPLRADAGAECVAPVEVNP